MVRILLLALQLIVGIIIIICDWIFLSSNCHCAPAESFGYFIIPFCWIITVVLIVNAIDRKKWKFIIFTILITSSVHICRHFMYEFDKKKYKEKVTGYFINQVVNPDNNDVRTMRIWLYPKFYKFSISFDIECSCSYIGNYLVRKDTIFFDNKIVENSSTYVQCKTFIKTSDTTIRPINDTATIFNKI